MLLAGGLRLIFAASFAGKPRLLCRVAKFRIKFALEISACTLNFKSQGAPEYDHGTLVKAIWILYYKGEIIEVVLDYDINRALRPKQFHRIWQLLDLNPKQTKLISRDEIIILLDNALQTYGYDGIWEQIPNYTMELQDLTNHGAK